MNQNFLAKLRNALGIAAVLCALMSAETASAQTYLPNNQAVQVTLSTLNGMIGVNGKGSVSSTLDGANTASAGTAVNANTVVGALYAEYLKMLLVELKQGQPTAVAIDNVYNTISQMGATGTRATTLDTVKQMVIDLLSN